MVRSINYFLALNICFKQIQQNIALPNCGTGQQEI